MQSTPLQAFTCNLFLFQVLFSSATLHSALPQTGRLHKIGSRVTKGTEIATLYSNISLEVCEQASQRLLDCVQFADSEEDVTVPQLIRCVVDKHGVTEWSGY